MSHEHLKSLHAQLENAKQSLTRLCAERSSLDRKIARKKHRITEIEQGIRNLTTPSPTVPDEITSDKILAYLKATKGIDIESIKRELTNIVYTDQLDASVPQKGIHNEKNADNCDSDNITTGRVCE